MQIREVRLQCHEFGRPGSSNSRLFRLTCRRQNVSHPRKKLGFKRMSINRRLQKENGFLIPLLFFCKPCSSQGRCNIAGSV